MLRGGHVPELDECRRIGELAGDGDDLVIAALRKRLHAELRAFVKLLDQNPRIRQAFESATGALEGRSQLAFLPDHGNALTS